MQPSPEKIEELSSPTLSIEEAKKLAGRSKNYYRYLCPELKKNKDIALIAIKKDYQALEFIDGSLNKDKDIARAAIKQNPMALSVVDESFRDDDEIVHQAINQSYFAFQYASTRFKKDRTLILNLIKKNPNLFQYIDESLQSDKEIVTIAVSKAPHLLGLVKAPFQANKALALKILESSIKYTYLPENMLTYFNDAVQNDEEIVHAIVNINPATLKYAKPKFKQDKALALCLINKHIYNLLSILAESLRNDKEVVTAACCKYPYDFPHIGSELLKDKPFMLDLIKTLPFLANARLTILDDSLQNDKEIVYAWLERIPTALEHAKASFKKDKELILKLIPLFKSYESIEQKIDKSLLADYEITKALLNHKADFVIKAHKKFKKNKPLMLEVIKKDGKLIQYIDKTLQEDIEVVLAAVNNTVSAYAHLSKKMKNNKDVILATYQKLTRYQVIDDVQINHFFKDKERIDIIDEYKSNLDQNDNTNDDLDLLCNLVAAPEEKEEKDEFEAASNLFCDLDFANLETQQQDLSETDLYQLNEQLKQGDLLSDIYDTQEGKPLLHSLIKCNSPVAIEIMQLLLGQGLDVEESNEENNTPLFFAVKQANVNAIKLLLQFGAIQSHANTNNALLYAISQSTLEINQHIYDTIISLLVKNAPPPLLVLQRRYSIEQRNHPLLTHASVTYELSADDIKALPQQIKHLILYKNISLGSLEALKSKGIKIEYKNILFNIDAKYLGGHLPKLESEQEKISRAKPRIKGIFEKENKTLIKLVTLSTLKNVEPQNTPLITLNRKGENFDFIQAKNKGELSSSDKIYTVFAYRKDNAYLPVINTNDNCRCIIVLTQNEYNSLKIQLGSVLECNYDFLILYPRKKLESEQDVEIARLIERRRAVIILARKHKDIINNIVFMDDNITEIAINNLNETNRSPSEALFDFMVEKMAQYDEPLVSIATFSRLNKKIKENQMGCKVWLMNFKKIHQKLPDSCLSALMLYNETKWGEDYFLQLLLNRLFEDSSKNIQGYKILPAQDIQLKRLQSHKSTCIKNGGMTATILNDNDILHPQEREAIKNSHPSILDSINYAKIVFNDAVQHRVNDYEKEKEYCRNIDLDSVRRLKSPIKFIKLAEPRSTSSSDTPIKIVTNAYKNGDFGDSDAVILYDDKLFYTEKSLEKVHEIKKLSSNSNNYNELINVISNPKTTPKNSKEKELQLLSSLISKTQVSSNLSGDFVSDLNAILNDSLKGSRGFHLKSLNKEVALRGYQNLALAWAANKLEETELKEFTFNMATGTGKTVLMLIMALAAFSANKQKNVILVFPSIQLVHQTLDKLFDDFKPLLDYFNIAKECIYGVCSKKSKNIEANGIIEVKHLVGYAKLHETGHIYLFCDDSLKGLNAIMQDKESNPLMDKLSTAVIDEAHKQETLLNSDGFSSRNEDTLIYKFSATPKKDAANNLVCPENEYQYLRKKAIRDHYLTPLLVDKTLPKYCSDKDIMNIILHQEHPNGKTLKEHKGILYVSSIEEANRIARQLQECPTLPEEFVHVFHSGDKEGINTKYDDYAAALEKFKSKDSGIAIVVQMLVEGYDDDKVDYVISNKPKITAKDVHQAVGRTLRLDKSNKEKIGFAILKNDNSENDKDEKTCYPENLEELEKQHKSLHPKVCDTIKKYSQTHNLKSTTGKRGRPSKNNHTNDEPITKKQTLKKNNTNIARKRVIIDSDTEQEFVRSPRAKIHINSDSENEGSSSSNQIQHGLSQSTIGLNIHSLFAPPAAIITGNAGARRASIELEEGEIDESQALAPK